MKKWSLILLLCLCVAMLAACGNSSGTDNGSANQSESAALPGTALAEAKGASAQPVDLDLSVLSGTVVYSQVYDMLENPDAYMGQRVKVKGNFSYFQDPDTKKEYFATVIADATACCAQGIEFVWAGEHTYPQDYPELDEEISVTGNFHTYEEAGYTYVELIDADVTWDGRL